MSKLDRLGRNARDIRNTIDHFHDRGVRIVILDLFGGSGIDLQGPVGSVIVAVMSAMAEMEAKNISERTKAKLQWAKARGLAYNHTEWGKKKVPCGSGKTIRGNPKCKFVWDLDFLRVMELFIERLRRGEKIWCLIAEFRAKFKDWRGEPFFASHDLKGNLHDPGHPTSLTMARRW